jgi:hypothetical protein
VYLLNLLSDVLEYMGIDPKALITHQGFAAEFEQDAFVL